MDWGIKPATGPFPESEYWEQEPAAAWTKQLQGAGQYNQAPYGQWLQGQSSRLWSNWMANQLQGFQQGGGAEGYTPFGSAQQTWNLDPGTWQSMVNAPSGSMTGDYLAGNPGTTFGMGLGAARGMGAPGPLVNWLGGQYSDLQNRYKASAQPGIEGSSNEMWRQWLDRYMRGG